VLEPLGLHDTSLIWSDRFADRIARTQDKEGRPEELWQPAVANAAYTAHTTPSDFARFMREIMRPGAGPLAPALVQTMLTPQVYVRGIVSWGLGWGLTDEPAFWQWGDNGGTRNFALGYPLRGDGVVIMTNGRRGLRVCNRIIRGTLGEFCPVFRDFLRPRYGRKAW
jgi:CubicO group peptidase (beta-lactamase class C family)